MRFTLELLLLGLLSGQSLHAAAPQESTPTAGASGLAGRVVVLESPELARQGLVEGLLRFAGGSALEPRDRRGATELLRRALFEHEGARALVPGVPGATLEMERGPMRFELRFRCAEGSLDEVLEVVARQLAEPRYDAARLEEARAGLRAQLESELELSGARPAAGAERAILQHVMGRDSIWVPVLWPPERPAVDLDAVRAQHARILVAANLSVAVACSAELNDVRERILAALASLPEGRPSPAGAPVQARVSGPAQVLILDRPELRRVELRVAAQVPEGARGAADALELWFASLSQRGSDDAPLREARRVVQGLRFEPLPEGAEPAPAAWVGAGTTSLEEASRGVELLLAVLSGEEQRDVLGEALASARAARAQERVAGSILARALDELEADGPREQPGDAEVAAAVQAFLEGKQRWIVVVGPAQELQDAFVGYEGREIVSRLDGPVDGMGAAAARDRLLEAMGGAERLARLDHVELVGEAGQEGLSQATQVRILRDLSGGRLMLDSRNGELASTVILRPDRGWTRVGERLIRLSAQQHALFLERERRQLLAVLRDLAVDEGLELDLDEDGHLLIGPPDDRLCWIELDEDGTPLRLGYAEGEGTRTYRYGDWRETDGVRWPAKVRGIESGSLFVWSEFDPQARIDAALFESGD